jgi:hypothetical protein
MNATYLKLAGELFDRAGMSVRAVQYLREALKWGGDDAAVRQQLEELESGRKRKTGLFGRAGE